MIYDDLNYEHEADIFANQQKYVKPLIPYEVFMANIEAGNDDQLIIRDLLASYGLQLSTKKGPGNVCAISTIEQIYKKYGYHGLNRVLRLIIGAWEGDSQSFSANMLNGVARLVVVYGDTLNDELFVDKLGAVSVKHIMRTAKERKAGSLGVAEAMVLEYNGKKKNSQYRLQLSKLYTRDAAIYKVIDDIPDEMLHDETPNVFESEMLDVYEPLIMVDELSEHSEEKMLCFP